MDQAQVTDIVTQFATDVARHRLATLESIAPGMHACGESLLTKMAMTGIAGTDAPATWLSMALYGQNLIDADSAVMQSIADSIGMMLFAIPGQDTYHVPDAWADTRMGTLWWSAVIRAQGDALITLAEASRISGMSLTALHGRITRGALRVWTNPDAVNIRNGRSLVRRVDLESLTPGRPTRQ